MVQIPRKVCLEKILPAALMDEILIPQIIHPMLMIPYSLWHNHIGEILFCEIFL